MKRAVAARRVFGVTRYVTPRDMRGDMRGDMAVPRRLSPSRVQGRPP